jgi:hypothetical protein
MIRTLDAKCFQLRFDWTGFALFFGAYRSKALKIFWGRYPRIVLDFTDNNPIIIGRKWRI